VGVASLRAGNCRRIVRPGPCSSMGSDGQTVLLLAHGIRRQVHYLAPVDIVVLRFESEARFVVGIVQSTSACLRGGNRRGRQAGRPAGQLVASRDGALRMQMSSRLMIQGSFSRSDALMAMLRATRIEVLHKGKEDVT